MNLPDLPSEYFIDPKTGDLVFPMADYSTIRLKAKDLINYNTILQSEEIREKLHLREPDDSHLLAIS